MDFLCLEFINSCFEHEAEISSAPLLDDEGLRRLCRKWGLPEQAKGIKARLPELRDELYIAAREYSETGAISAESLAGLNALLSPVLFHKSLVPGGAGFSIGEVSQQDEDTLLPHRIVMSFAELASNYDVRRLKVCENPDCGWIFYDESKNRTRRWCDNTCASLIKVRRFRQKHAAGA